MLDAIDDQELGWTFADLQLQSELFLDGGEESRTADGLRTGSLGRWTRTRVGCPIQLEIVLAGESRVIRHVTIELPRKDCGDRGRGESRSLQRSTPPARAR